MSTGTGHKMRVVRVVVCECGWQEQSNRVVSLDTAAREHQAQMQAVSLRKHLVVQR